jgi:hypothetical protein
MIHLISLLVSIMLAIYIKRKGLTTVELREMLVKQVTRLREAVVNVKVYRWASGNVWIKFDYEGWVHARWCSNAAEGYLVRCDGTIGMTHKNYTGIVSLEDYSRK